MTAPGQDNALSVPLTPARRGRDRMRTQAASPTTETLSYDDADLQRGLAAAVLAGLGRMQLKLEALARQQSEGLARLQAAVTALDARIEALESSTPTLSPEPPVTTHPPEIPPGQSPSF